VSGPAATPGGSLPSAGRWTGLVRLLRPKQWIKNSFVLAPLVFSLRFHDRAAVAAALLAAAAFCLASSATYVVNDLVDRERDGLHPVKRLSRPLAAGLVGSRDAIGVLLVLAAGLSVLLTTNPRLVPGVGAYLAVSVSYSLLWKRLPVFDLFALAAGFVLRVWGGAVAIDVPLSSWMLITTLCLALYLAAAKRLAERRTSGFATREVLSAYSESLLERFVERAAVGAMVFYALFVVTPRPELAMTVPVVLFGLYRHSYVAERANLGESPTDALWRDIPLLLTVVAWGVWCLVALRAP
jgi:decaprenyl-phosphate phosphoribosyltransferase